MSFLYFFLQLLLTENLPYNNLVTLNFIYMITYWLINTIERLTFMPIAHTIFVHLIFRGWGCGHRLTRASTTATGLRETALAPLCSLPEMLDAEGISEAFLLSLKETWIMYLTKVSVSAKSVSYLPEVTDIGFGKRTFMRESLVDSMYGLCVEIVTSARHPNVVRCHDSIVVAHICCCLDGGFLYCSIYFVQESGIKVPMQFPATQ